MSAVAFVNIFLKSIVLIFVVVFEGVGGRGGSGSVGWLVVDAGSLNKINNTINLLVLQTLGSMVSMAIESSGKENK